MRSIVVIPVQKLSSWTSQSMMSPNVNGAASTSKREVNRITNISS